MSVKAFFTAALVHRTVADVLQNPLRFVVQRPLLLALLIVCSYIAWLPLALLFRALCYLLTTPLASLLIALFILWLARFIARFMTFPCSFPVVSKSIEREVAARMRERLLDTLASFAVCIQQAAADTSNSDVAATRAVMSTLGDALEMWTSVQHVLEKMHENQALSAHATVFLHYMRMLTASMRIVQRSMAKNGVNAAAWDAPMVMDDVRMSVDALNVPPSTAGTSTAAAGVPAQASPPADWRYAAPHVLEAGVAPIPADASARCLSALAQLSGQPLRELLPVLNRCRALVWVYSAWLELLPMHRVRPVLLDIAKVSGMDSSAVAAFAPPTRCCHINTRAPPGIAGIPLQPVSNLGFPPQYAAGSDLSTHVLASMSLDDASVGVPLNIFHDILTSQAPVRGRARSRASSTASIERGPQHASASAGASNPDSAAASPAEASATPSGPFFVRMWRAFATSAIVIAIAENAAGIAAGIASFFRAASVPSPICGCDFMRAELIIRRRGVHVWIPGAHGNTIDAVYVPSPHALQGVSGATTPPLGDIAGHGQRRERTMEYIAALHGHASMQWARVCMPSRRGTSGNVSHQPLLRSNGDESSASPVASIRQLIPHESAVVIFCNPNAGMYEMTHRQTDWLDLYAAQGCGMLLYNYRGYGRSTGTPGPGNLRADGDAIVAALSRDYGATRVFVHGESIGGVVATHLAGRGSVDLLIADRNFDELPRTAGELIGAWAELALRVFTRWGASNAEAYLRAPPTCAKILAMDTNDAVIHWNASLALGISRRSLIADSNGAPQVIAPEATVPAGSAPAALENVHVSVPDERASLPHDVLAELHDISGGLYFLLLDTAARCAGAFGASNMLQGGTDALESSAVDADAAAPESEIRASAPAAPSTRHTHSRSFALGPTAASMHTAAAAAETTQAGGTASPSLRARGAGARGTTDPASPASPAAAGPSGSAHIASSTAMAAAVAVPPVDAPRLRAFSSPVGRSGRANDAHVEDQALLALPEHMMNAVHACLKRRGVNISPASPAFSTACEWVLGDLTADVDVFSMILSAARRTCIRHECAIAMRLKMTLPTRAPTVKAHSGGLHHSSLMQGLKSAATALPAPASSLLHTVEDSLDAAAVTSPLTPANAASPALPSELLQRSRLARTTLHMAQRNVLRSDTLPDTPLHADAAMFVTQAQAGIGYATCGLIILAGMTNGVGSRLGSAVVAGAGVSVAGVLNFLTGALAYGFHLQHGFGAGAAALALVDAPPHDGDAEPSVHANVDEAGGWQFGRSPPYLVKEGECGAESALRRMLALQAAAATDAQADVVTRAFLQHAVELLQRLVVLQRRLHRADAASPVPAAPQDSQASFVAAMRSPRGLCIPLTCGHNAAWVPQEAALITAAVRAALLDMDRSRAPASSVATAPVTAAAGESASSLAPASEAASIV